METSSGTSSSPSEQPNEVEKKQLGQEHGRGGIWVAIGLTLALVLLIVLNMN
jgi:hypothetical protein